jgi:hypothetical protein
VFRLRAAQPVIANVGLSKGNSAWTRERQLSYGRRIVANSPSVGELIRALRAGKLDEVWAAVEADPKLAGQARLVVAAGGQARQPTLAVLKKHGGDLNASWRNYRAIHALLQRSHTRRPGSQHPHGWHAWNGYCAMEPIPNGSARGLPRVRLS